VHFGFQFLGLCFEGFRNWYYGGSELGCDVMWFFFIVQQQEDEEMLVPHADLPENNHQPMEGSYCFLFLLIRVENLLFLEELRFTVFSAFVSCN
jgi:hypothetical protein